MTRSVPESGVVYRRKSAYSNGTGGACVEVAPGFDVVPVRDSKDRAVGHLMVTSRSWAALVSSVKAS